LKRSTIAVLGVSYRANVKEATNSPTIAVVRRLLKRGTRVRVYDPYFTSREIEAFDCPAVDSLERAIGGADCLVIAVPHDAFQQIRLEDVARLLKQPACIVDTWRMFDAREVESHHLVYIGLGVGR
jgi:UDPglucose 6-dehydrogenase